MYTLHPGTQGPLQQGSRLSSGSASPHALAIPQSLNFPLPLWHCCTFLPPSHSLSKSYQVLIPTQVPLPKKTLLETSAQRDFWTIRVTVVSASPAQMEKQPVFFLFSTNSSDYQSYQNMLPYSERLFCIWYSLASEYFDLRLAGQLRLDILSKVTN